MFIHLEHVEHLEHLEPKLLNYIKNEDAQINMLEHLDEHLHFL